MQASHKLAEAVYQQAQQAAAVGRRRRGPTADENVEEADYEVIDDDESK